MFRRKTTARRKSSTRKGTSSVEFAIFLPVLVTLTIGTIDLCSVLYLKETATLAAYEGARQGIGRGRTNANSTARIFDFLDERGVNYDEGSVVSYSSPGFDGADALENVTVTVTVPCQGKLVSRIGLV